MVARLSRVIPMLLVLALVAAVVYVFVAYTKSPLRAKEVVIKMFLAITGVLSAFFGLLTLYSLFESNEGVFDLAVSFLLTALVGLGITLLCRWRFLKNHPNYRLKPERGAAGRAPFEGFRGPGGAGGTGGAGGSTGDGSTGGATGGGTAGGSTGGGRDGYTPGPTANVPGAGMVTLIRMILRMMGR